MGEHARDANDVAVARNAVDQLFEGQALDETLLALPPGSNRLYGGADTIDHVDLVAESASERQLHWPDKVLPCPLPAGQP